MKTILFLIMIGYVILSSLVNANQIDYEHFLSLNLKAESAAYVFDVPKSVYQNVYHSNLSDVRVVNSNGDYVPMRLAANSEEIEQHYSQTSLPIFKLNKVQSTPINTKQTRTTSSGSVEDYTVETSKSMRYFIENQETQDNSVIYIDANVLEKQKIDKLSIDWQYETRGNRIFYVKLSGSNDLSNWQTIKSHYKLLEIKSGAKTILENDIDLNQSSYLYYQLVFKDQIVPEITSVEAHLITHLSHTKKNWSDINTLALINDKELTFDTGGLYPIESIRIDFRQKNTLTDVVLYSRDDNKRKWKYVESGNVYSITTNGEVITKDRINFRTTHNRYWKIVLDDNIKNSTVKSIQFAWSNHQIEFLAQGEPPFRLVFGNKKQTRRPVNDWYSQLPSDIKFSNQVVISDFKESKSIEPQSDIIKPNLNKSKLIFWLVLSIVILLLVFMAYKLVVEKLE